MPKQPPTPCAIDTETTGLDPFLHQVVELAIVPLTPGFEPDPNRAPFHVIVNPGAAHIAELPYPCRALTINGHSRDTILADGLPKALVGHELKQWMQRTGIDRIAPLAQNWAFDKIMLAGVLGPDTMARLIDYHARDTQPLALAINDTAARHNEPLPFESVSLQSLARELGIDSGQAHTAIDDARTCANVYRDLLNILSYQTGRQRR